jgi:hypothetical protein
MGSALTLVLGRCFRFSFFLAMAAVVLNQKYS